MVNRENAAAKGRRYLGEGRLVIDTIDEKRIIATCRGAGEIHLCGYKPGGWFCSCLARGLCSHLVALQSVTVAPPTRRAYPDEVHA